VRILKILLLALPLVTFGAKAQQTLTITHVTIIDTVTGKTQPNTTVMVQGNRITAIAPSTSMVAKAGQIVDGTGDFLIPGLWDMHTHVYFDSTAADGPILFYPSSWPMESPGCAIWAANLMMCSRLVTGSPRTSFWVLAW
jgi:hypothetical protein